MKTIMLAATLLVSLNLSGCTEKLPGSDAMHNGTNPSHANPPVITIRLIDAQGQPTDAISTPKVIKTDAQWQSQLTREQYDIARGRGTERAFCGLLHDNKEPGIYTCVCCELPLFSSQAKFNSGTGWPSFFQPVAPENVVSQRDTSYGMIRTEILCARCDAHLGHVFEDGPRPTGLRYCLNSASMKFVPQTQIPELSAQLQKVIQPVTIKVQ